MNVAMRVCCLAAATIASRVCWLLAVQVWLLVVTKCWAISMLNDTRIWIINVNTVKRNKISKKCSLCLLGEHRYVHTVLYFFKNLLCSGQESIFDILTSFCRGFHVYQVLFLCKVCSFFVRNFSLASKIQLVTDKNNLASFWSKVSSVGEPSCKVIKCLASCYIVAKKRTSRSSKVYLCDRFKAFLASGILFKKCVKLLLRGYLGKYYKPTKKI